MSEQGSHHSRGISVQAIRHFIKVQDYYFNALSQTIQQEPNARINPRRANTIQATPKEAP
jgi:hypothetical protein